MPARLARLVWVVPTMAVLLTGCGDRIVDLPTNRHPAAPQVMGGGPVRCPDDTVGYADDDQRSGAGAVPVNFDGRTVLRCLVDYSTQKEAGAGTMRYTISQWGAPLTNELRTALDLPDTEIRPRRPCAISTRGTTSVYLIDGARRSVRVLMPFDSSCRQISAGILPLLPDDESPPETTFIVTRADP